MEHLADTTTNMPPRGTSRGVPARPLHTTPVAAESKRNGLVSQASRTLGSEVGRRRDNLRGPGAHAAATDGLSALRLPGSVSSAWTAWTTYRRACGRSPATLKIDRSALRFCHSQGITLLADIEPAALDRYLLSLQEKGRSTRTQAMFLAAMKRWLGFCLERRLIEENPLATANPIRVLPVRDRRALTQGEIHRLLEVSPESFRRMWTTYLTTGMRHLELVRLTWSDVDLDEGLIHLDARSTKTRTSRFCVLGPKMIRMLQDVRGESSPLGGGDSLVFPNRYGRPHHNNLLRRFYGCCRKAGLDTRGLDLHALRVTFGTMCFDVGADLRTAQALIGHGRMRTGILMLDRYAKPRIELMRDVAEKVEALVFAI